MEALSRQKPVLMILEDAHWADPTSMEAFSRAVDRTRTFGVLLIVTYRPEFEPPWTGRPNVSILAQSTLKTPSFLGKILMGRPKGAKNKLTILREAHKARIDALREPEIIDSLHVLERSMRHFFIRAEMGMNAGRNQSEVDADYEKAAHLAALVAPYRHAQLSAMKLAGDPNNSAPFKDGASVDELREEIMQDLGAFGFGGCNRPEGFASARWWN